MVNTILAKRVNHIVAKGGNPACPKGSKSRGFSTITKLAKTDEVEAGKVLFANCWLGGSAELEKDAVLFMAVQVQLGKLVNGCMGSIKNL